MTSTFVRKHRWLLVSTKHQALISVYMRTSTIVYYVDYSEGSIILLTHDDLHLHKHKYTTASCKCESHALPVCMCVLHLFNTHTHTTATTYVHTMQHLHTHTQVNQTGSHSGQTWDTDDHRPSCSNPSKSDTHHSSSEVNNG